jgi:acetoin utilization protein AcuC
MTASTLGSVNLLPEEEKREIYTRLIPPELISRLSIPKDFIDRNSNDLLRLDCPAGSTSSEMRLYHQAGFPDPVLQGEITGTLNGLVHILLYVLNDPQSPRFDIDRMPDGTPTFFGITQRNMEAELAAMSFGLAPGQIRRGLRLLGSAIHAFEGFVASLGHELFLAEPLFYHNAVLFERYGFAYEKGKRLMEQIQAGFLPDGELIKRLDASTRFREPEAANSIRLRSWAIHDGLLGEPFTNVTMYKRVGNNAQLSTCTGCSW